VADAHGSGPPRRCQRMCFYAGFGGLKTMELLLVAVVLVVAYAVLYAIVRLRCGYR